MIIRENGSVDTPRGFFAAGIAAGLKKNGEKDMALIHSKSLCGTAAVFTQNSAAAAPVIIDKETLKNSGSYCHSVVINSKNANACTGVKGIENGYTIQKCLGKELSVDKSHVLTLSTGVIGVQLPMDIIKKGITSLCTEIHNNSSSGHEAAEAIMTTDTKPKSIAVDIMLSEGMVSIGGIAKGAGMIHPNMATMLSVITSDLKIEPPALQEMLSTVVDKSFNRISVDGDTSTNDTVLLLANGESYVSLVNKADCQLFVNGLLYVAQQLAQMIVRDGEGVSKFVTISVSGAQSDKEAHTVANAIAISPLVKTAFAGSDPNWGRIVAAAGNSGVVFKMEDLNLSIKNQNNTILLLSKGLPTGYSETEAQNVFAEKEFTILFDIGDDLGRATVWTSDFTEEYIRINADYRT